MSYLLDTNIVSAHVRRSSRLAHRFLQHSGRLFVPAMVEAELYVWAYGRDDPSELMRAIHEFLGDCHLLAFDSECARWFGQARATMQRGGVGIADMDLMIASVAVVHGLTLVTNNVAHFAPVPGLAIEDWLTP